MFKPEIPAVTSEATAELLPGYARYRALAANVPEAGVEYPDDAFLRYRVTALVDALAWSGPPGQDPIADTLRENLTVGAWCLAVAEYAAWMPQTLKGCPLRRV